MNNWRNLSVKDKMGLLGLVSIVAILISIYLNALYSRNDLKKNGVLVNVFVVERLSSAKGVGINRSNFLCRFSWKGVEREEISFNDIPIKKAKEIIRDSCWAIFSDRTNTLHLILTQEDSIEYNIGN